ncbi:hypothetical protein [Flavobacterium sp. 7A]|uniref:hypothetical protein n=1 Tax=Flavobacterium sp. 7A TaxID=2940571 RepID=UPI00222763B6|nr:hypothetical protein [Flavobacterium sp. 7A]MCW2118873.1 hypothetical protein [Flavobacterium sp. 7A]
MKIWRNYKSIVRNNLLLYSNTNKDLQYWRNDMFANTLIYIIPLSIIALIPSVLWALELKLYLLITVDITAVSLTTFISLKKGIDIKKRKLLFVSTLYILSFFLVYYTGLNSTLYLLATCFLSTFIYSFKNQYTPAILNIYISIIYTIFYYTHLIPLLFAHFQTSVLIAVFANLIFLSFLICSLVPKLFNGLDENFKKNIEHNNKIEKRNELLKEITWIQSHVVRAPLSRLMAITAILKDNDVTEDERTFFIDNIIISSTELDTIIKEIVTKSESIRST